MTVLICTDPKFDVRDAQQHILKLNPESNREEIAMSNQKFSEILFLISYRLFSKNQESKQNDEMEKISKD
jgi:hypothetical protein